MGNYLHKVAPLQPHPPPPLLCGRVQRRQAQPQVEVWHKCRRCSCQFHFPPRRNHRISSLSSSVETHLSRFCSVFNGSVERCEETELPFVTLKGWQLRSSNKLFMFSLWEPSHSKNPATLNLNQILYFSALISSDTQFRIKMDHF